MRSSVIFVIVLIVFIGFGSIFVTATNTPPTVTAITTATNKTIVVPRNGNQPNPVTRPLWHMTAGVNDTLFLFGEVAEENSEAVSQGILSLNDVASTAPILLVIDSPGGAVFAGSKIVSAMEASKRPVYTICYGLCASMAAMIHQYGHKRLMTNRSVLMFHNASGAAQGEVNQMLSQLNFVDKFCMKMDIFIASRAGISYKEFSHLLDSQLWLDAQDASNLGYNDRIVALNLSNVKKTVLLPFMNRTKHATERVEVK